MIQNGPGDIQLIDDESISNIQSYGIDWEDYDDDSILDHHRQANQDDNPDDNPFISN